MNLDDFKPLTKRVTAPAGAPSAAENLGSFIAEMRSRDQRSRRLALGMALILFAVGAVFVAVGTSRFPGVGLIGVGMMLSAGYVCLKGRSFGRVDYGAPAREFLAAAARRYGFLGMKDAPALVPLLVMGLGGALAVYHAAAQHLNERGALLALGGYLVFMAALCVFALVVSRKDWHREHAGLLREIRRREQELQNG